MDKAQKTIYDFWNSEKRLYLYLIVVSFLTLISLRNITTYAPESTYYPEERIDSPSIIPILIVQIVIVTGILIAVFKLIKIKLVALLFELFIVLFPTSMFFFLIFIPYGFNEETALLSAVGITIILFFAKQKYQNIKDFLAITASVGISALMIMTFSDFVIILIAVMLFFYDIFAVFISKHMVFFARNIVKHNLPMTVTTYVPVAGGEAETHLTMNKTEEKGIETKELEKKSEPKKALARLDLGTGDLIMFSVLSVVNANLGGFLAYIGSLMFGLISVRYMLDYVLARKLVFPALVAIVPPMILIYLAIVIARTAVGG